MIWYRHLTAGRCLYYNIIWYYVYAGTKYKFDSRNPTDSKQEENSFPEQMFCQCPHFGYFLMNFVVFFS